MPAQRVSMRKTRDILRLRLGEKPTEDATAQSVGGSGSARAAATRACGDQKYSQASGSCRYTVMGIDGP